MSNRAKVRHAARLASQRLARQRRQRMVWTSTIASAVLLVAGLIGVVAWQTSQPEDDAARSTLDTYLADGTVTLAYRPIAILDRLTTTGFSTRAAAAGCAADSGAIDEFVAAMLASQPPEGSAGLSDDEIVQIAAGAGLAEPSFAECVRDGSYHDWVDRTTDAASDRGVSGTPTVFVNGERLDLSSLEDLLTAVEAARS